LTDPVNEPPLQQKTDGVADLEPEIDVGVVHRRPAHLLRQNRLHDPQRGAVDVIQGGGEKHQCQHAPAGFADGKGTTDFLAHSSVGVHGSGCGWRRRSRV
jgi:hypothetical protein